jgi:hypothetical protein
MRIQRGGRCTICNVKTREWKTFDQTVDMFNPSDSPTITPDLRLKLIEWRDTVPIRCQDHPVALIPEPEPKKASASSSTDSATTLPLPNIKE